MSASRILQPRKTFHKPQGAAGILPAEETPCRRDVGSTLLVACLVPGSWSQCMCKSKRGLSMNLDSQTRMTNDE
jgi:hypothetical protein